jgi:hypothetical protein
MIYAPAIGSASEFRRDFDEKPEKSVHIHPASSRRTRIFRSAIPSGPSLRQGIAA